MTCCVFVKNYIRLSSNSIPVARLLFKEATKWQSQVTTCSSASVAASLRLKHTLCTPVGEGAPERSDVQTDVPYTVSSRCPWQSVWEGKSRSDLLQVELWKWNSLNKRSYCTRPGGDGSSTTTSTQVQGDSTQVQGDSAQVQGDSAQVQLSQKDKLKRAVKEYGSTVIVFHIAISLASLGGFYLAVSSGIDMVGILKSISVGETILQSKLAAGTGTFVVAYAVHKVFAPVRIGITLTCTPLIVRYLRSKGILKPPKPKA